MDKQKAYKRLAVLGIICSIISMALLLLWTAAFFQAETHAERVSIYSNFALIKLLNPANTNLVGLAGSLLAIIFSNFGLNIQSRGWKITSTSILILSGITLIIFIWWSL